MVRGDIIGGLKIALSKGKSLQEVMQSFYNSGYKKEDIEEAARILKTEGFQPQVIQKINPASPLVQSEKKEIHPSYSPPPIQAVGNISQPKSVLTEPKPTRPIFPISQPTPQAPLITSPITKPSTPSPVQIQQNFQAPRQTVSSYGMHEERSGVDVITVILIVVLVLLVGVLFGVFFFKAEIVKFLNQILA